MKIQLEEIPKDASSSFRILVNPNLSDFFYWHFHPEIELVYIEGADGTRHVGDHISSFIGSDLVLIGSNIPHLNFDYGIKTAYRKTVIQLRPDFLDTSLSNTPELQVIEQLLNLSKYGVVFDGPVKKEIGRRMQELHLRDSFEQFREMLYILQHLALSQDKHVLHEYPVLNPYGQKDKIRLEKVFTYIEEHYKESIDLTAMASLCHLTREAFCRYFKRMTRLTFTAFVNNYRIDAAKKLLLQDVQIVDVCFECGFESVSYFNRVFKKVTGYSPSAFKRKHLSVNQLITK